MRIRQATIPRHLLVALAVAATCGALTTPADACGGGWWPEIEIDYRVQGIARAEKDLQKGKYDDAAGAVLRMIPHIQAYKQASRDDIVNRALRVLAVATARKDGQLDVKAQLPHELRATWLGEKAAERDANLKWTVSALKAVATKKKNDPVIESELGEAMAKVPAYREEGRKLLEKLAAKDLLTTPEAYAALAQLRADSGDKDGRLAALVRCKAMAKNAAICSSKAHGQS